MRELHIFCPFLFVFLLSALQLRERVRERVRKKPTCLILPISFCLPLIERILFVSAHFLRLLLKHDKHTTHINGLFCLLRE